MASELIEIIPFLKPHCCLFSRVSCCKDAIFPPRRAKKEILLFPEGPTPRPVLFRDHETPMKPGVGRRIQMEQSGSHRAHFSRSVLFEHPNPLEVGERLEVVLVHMYITADILPRHVHSRKLIPRLCLVSKYVTI